MTLILIVANIAAAFLMVFQPDLIFDFGFNPVRPTAQSALASMFLHANLFHLLGNMLFLAAVGATVELATGALRFVIVYFVSGLAGVGLHFLLAAKNLSEPHPLVGASGCIAGCAAYYGFRYMGLKVPLAPKLNVPVIVIIAAWFLLQVLGAFTTIGDTTASTAFWAHLGGFGAGVLLSVLFRAPDVGQLRMGQAVVDRMVDRGPAATATAALQHLVRHPDDPKALQQLIGAHALMNDKTSEADALLKLLELLPDCDLGPPVRRLAELGALKRLPPFRRRSLALTLAGTDETATRLLLESVMAEPVGEAQRPEAMLALAEIQMQESPDDARALLGQLAHEYPLHPTVQLARAKGWIS